LDFAKPYDKVSWSFIFEYLHKIGFPPKFEHMVQILFVDVEAFVNLNGVATSFFPILHGVRQGYLLAPCLFMLVGEALNQVVKSNMVSGRILDINFPSSNGHQFILQYTNDTRFIIKCEKNSMENIV
jgi:hypothetical protein